MLSKISQMAEDKCHMISLIYKYITNKIEHKIMNKPNKTKS